MMKADKDGDVFRVGAFGDLKVIRGGSRDSREITSDPAAKSSEGNSFR